MTNPVPHPSEDCVLANTTQKSKAPSPSQWPCRDNFPRYYHLLRVIRKAHCGCISSKAELPRMSWPSSLKVVGLREFKPWDNGVSEE